MARNTAGGGRRIYEDSPQWNPRTMGNQRGTVPSARHAALMKLAKQAHTLLDRGLANQVGHRNDYRQRWPRHPGP